MLFLKDALDELIVGYKVAKINDSHGSLRRHTAIHVLRIRSHLEVIRLAQVRYDPMKQDLLLLDALLCTHEHLGPLWLHLLHLVELQLLVLHLHLERHDLVRIELARAICNAHEPPYSLSGGRSLVLRKASRVL